MTTRYRMITPRKPLNEVAAKIIAEIEQERVKNSRIEFKDTINKAETEERLKRYQEEYENALRDQEALEKISKGK